MYDDEDYDDNDDYDDDEYDLDDNVYDTKGLFDDGNEGKQDNEGMLDNVDENETDLHNTSELWVFGRSQLHIIFQWFLLEVFLR